MSSPDMAPRPVTSLMFTVSLASWRPLIGREPRYWPLIGQRLVTITQSADMSLTVRGEMHFLLWQEYWVTKFTLCSSQSCLLTRQWVSEDRSSWRIYHCCGLPDLVLKLLYSNPSFLLCSSLNYVDLHFSFMAQTASSLWKEKEWKLFTNSNLLNSLTALSVQNIIIR